jgi:hypothetical protein
VDEQLSNDVLALALARFQFAQDAESEIRRESLEDVRFFSGEHWPEAIRRDRDLDGRPCLTINRLPQFVNQVVNDARQNLPAAQINAVDDGTDVDTAEVVQGLVRHIEVSSDAPAAYITALEQAAIGGFGYFRAIPKYAGADSFDLDIAIEAVANPFQVYLDPAARRPDRSDAKWAFVVEQLTPDEFKAQYPDAEMSGMDGYASIGDRHPGWATTEAIRVAEYFSIEPRKRTLCMLMDGSVAFQDELAEGAPVVRRREVDYPVVMWRKITATEILEETTLPGEHVPVFQVLGKEIFVDGARKVWGMVRFARDPQRMYDFWATAETETIALAPRAPFIAAEGQIEGHEAQWRAANKRNFAVLQYKPRAIGDHLVPAPQRNTYEPPVQAITQARMMSADDLKSTTGIYDASLGNRSNETSGVAIRQRQVEGDTANYHFSDNLARAIRHCTKVILSWIPTYYDTPRVLRIIGRDEQQQTVKVNQPTRHKGVEKVFDLTAGKYDVTVSVGPSYQTKRQEAAQSMMQMTQAFPPLFQAAGDLLVRNLDWPGAQEIAERLRKTLPAQLQENGEKQQPIPPQVQQQLMQMDQMIQQLTAGLNEATQTIETRKLELESKERIAALQTQAQLLMTQAKLGSQEGLELLRQEIAVIGAQLDQMNREKEREDMLEQQERDREAAAAAVPPEDPGAAA